MALFCRASPSIVSLNTATGLRSQRTLRLPSLCASTSLSRRHASLASVVRCDAAGHPESQRVAGSLFKHNIKAATPPTSLETTSSEEQPKSPLIPAKLTSTIVSILQQAWKPAVISLLIAAVLFSMPAGDAMAAQGGGRVGGKSGFSASRSRSYSAPSQSYSAPRSGPSTYVAPSVGYSAPFFFAPSPFFFGGPTVYLGGGGGGGGLFSFLLLGIVAVFVVSAILNFWGGQTEEEVWEASQRSSVVRLQVGLMGSARQLQKDLEKMATRADTSSPEGLHYVLQESVLTLLRNPDYCIYGYSTSTVGKDSYEGEQVFNRLSLEERSKFREETLVNVGDVRKRVDRTAARDSVGSEYIVVTIIAATEGEFTLPEIKSQADLRTALTTLGSINSEELQAVEILWTPENEEDTLTTKDMLQDYPLLTVL